jgi:HAD superfamily hydrolase (TIGR01509 family)
VTARRIEAVIFDCDGTLVDSEPLARRAWERGLAPYGYTIADADYESLIGLPFARTHAFFAERIPGLPPADAFWGQYAGTLFALIDGELEPFPDALDTVRALARRGVRLAVASSSPRARLDRTLAKAGLQDAFEVSVAGDEIEHGKPAPDMFLAAAARLDVAPAACVVIEDSPPGVLAGLAAGMHTVGVARAPDAAAGLREADRVVERLTAAAVLGA